jgi:hypothetical protein
MAKLSITVDAEAIRDALVAYVAAQGLSLKGKDVDVSITAGRGSNGFSANIDISTPTAQIQSTAQDTYVEDTVEEEEQVTVEEPSDDTNIFNR